MKIEIGPYKSWIGPYQIADKIPFISTDRREKIGDWLSKTWVDKVCVWIDQKKKRKEYVRIDKWDTWSMDHTLALIIVPMLKQLRDTKHGAPFVDDDDVPTELRSTSAPPKKNEWDTDENHFKRWNWALDEMIFAFENIVDDSWQDERIGKDTFIKYNDRISFGLMLFGKYYRGLWD